MNDFDLIDAFVNFSNSFAGLTTLLEAFCYVAGFIMSIFGILRLRSITDQRVQGTPSSAFASITIGVLLVFMPQVLGDLAKTVWDNNGCGSFASFHDYITADSCGSKNEYIGPIVSFIQLYGLFAAVRGLLLFNRAAKSGGQNSDEIIVKGAVHLIFGLLCVHIVDTFSILSGTFLPVGFDLSSYLN